VSTTTVPTVMLDKLFPGENQNFAALDYVHKYGRASWALLMANLFLPEFCELDGSVLLSTAVEGEHSRSRFFDAVSSSSTSRSDLEQSFNFVEIGYLFDSNGRDVDESGDQCLRECIAEAWRRSLAAKFPHRTFDVKTLEPVESGSTVAITFSERR
jgi:hypothetical protein